MQFKLGYLKSESLVEVRSFNPEGDTKNVSLDLQSIVDENLQGLIYDDTQSQENIIEFLEREHRFYPIRRSSDLALNFDEFKNLEFSKAQEIYSKLQTPWILGHNLSTLEELFTILGHLRSLFDNERSSFFEELWFVLRNNLGSRDLTLVYNDLKKGEGENEKDKLIRTKVSGTRLPSPVDGGELEDKLMENYANEFSNTFQISEYSCAKGQLVITATINKSPVLLMANINQFNQLQKAILTALFNGINQTLAQ